MQEKQTRGIGFCSILTILFIGLKLTGYISWSWLWVLSPLWLGLAITFGLIFAVMGIGLIIVIGAHVIEWVIKLYKKIF